MPPRTKNKTKPNEQRRKTKYVVQPVLTVSFDRRTIEASSKAEARRLAKALAAELFVEFVAEAPDKFKDDVYVRVYEATAQTRSAHAGFGELLAEHEEPGDR